MSKPSIWGREPALILGALQADADRKQLQRDIGCKWVDGKWSRVGSEMPGRLRDAVGGVQRAMGIPIDRVWTDAVEGVQFKRLYTAAGFKP